MEAGDPRVAALKEKKNWLSFLIIYGILPITINMTKYDTIAHVFDSYPVF